MGRDFFSGGSELDATFPVLLSSVLECFEAFASFGVVGRVRVSGLSGSQTKEHEDGLLGVLGAVHWAMVAE